jgi:uncharacterized protein YdeI (YjbR/CyaY-like superfamily)
MRGRFGRSGAVTVLCEIGVDEVNPQVSDLLERSEAWRAEFAALRALVLAHSALTEGLKWGQACYALDGKNVVLIHGFKHYCALLFFKGALLEAHDPQRLLVQQSERVQAARQVRFTSVDQIRAQSGAVHALIEAAIAAERSGHTVVLKTTADFAVSAEFQARLEGMPALRDAFGALTPGRQRAYLLHFAAPKRTQTRAARVEASIPRILDGFGLDD